MAGEGSHWVSRLVTVGKRVASSLYVHISAVSSLPPSAQEAIARGRAIAGVDEDAFNVVRLEDAGSSLSLLLYPKFFEEAFPCLAVSYRVDLRTSVVTKREYACDTSPPILHRKETLLAINDPRRSQFEELTRKAESMGLFENPASIGTKQAWEARLTRLRLRIDGHRLVETGGAAASSGDGVQIQRHRTALQRYSLSTPMQALWRHGFLYYGCGRGDDIKILREQGVEACGWDPHFRPNEKRENADVVNLGFVINVIESLEERREALTGSFGLARKVLAVSALIGGRSAYEQYRLFRDGVVTTRGTFQKYFTQQELRDYLQETLAATPLPSLPASSSYSGLTPTSRRFSLRGRHARDAATFSQSSPATNR